MSKRLLTATGAALLLLVLYLSNLSLMGLVSVDEPRYADIGRAMALSGDWITPRLSGVPWFEKPPLLYWLVAVGFKLGLGPETAPRAPVAVVGLGFLWFYWWSLRRLWDLRVATLATAFLATSAGWIAYSRLALTDIPLAVLFNVALLAALSPGRRNTLLAATALGLAVLAKSLVPLVLFAPVLALSIPAGGPRRLKDWLSPAPLACFLICAVPWHVVCDRRNGPVFIQTLFFEHQFGRAVSSSLQHVQPFWYYLPVLAMLLFPWFPLLGLVRVEWRDQKLRTLASVVVFGFVFLSTVVNKLPHYVLPLVPSICILMAMGLARAKRPQLAMVLPMALLGLLPVAAQVLPNALAHGLRSTPVLISSALGWVGVMLVVGLVLVLVVKDRALAVVPVVVAGAFLWLQWTAFPQLDKAASARPMWLAKHPDCLETANRATDYGLAYYSGHRLLPCGYTGAMTRSGAVMAVALASAGVGVADAQTWDKLVDRYFHEAIFPFGTSGGVQSGFHQYDSSLDDLSAAGISKQNELLRRVEKEVSAFPASTPDRELVLANIHAGLLANESIRMWEKNPDLYSSAASNAAFVIMSRSFAPADARLRSLVAREKQMPRMFADARANLKNPPKVYTEVAIEQLPGIVSFFESDVPKAFDQVKDQALNDDFRKANAAVVAELKAYEKWLKTDLLARSKGDFRIGAENYRKKLAYDEMVDIPLDKLLQIGYTDLRKNQQWFRETARKIDPKKTPEQILDQSGRNHPAPDKLLQAFRDTLEGLRTYIEAKGIATVPSRVMPIIEETPPFARALTFASMDMPGPYEKVAKESFFNVTLPEKTWTQKQVDEHMAAFNHGVILSTAIHEAFPGHYLQGLWIDKAPSMARRLIAANTYVEGWAHYTEQMMLDEGYGNGDPVLRLGQLQDALLRNARFIVGMEMHTGKMTFEQGVDFFVKEGFQTRTNGERETKRGTSDPTYLYYTLGKLEILKLREDYKKKMGPKYSLREFHNRLLSQGMPPIKVARKELLGDDSPVL